MSYSVSVLKDWLLVWLLLYTTTVNICRAACTNPQGGNGDIRVKGTVNATAIAGRMEICDGMEWRAVCNADWGLQDAMVVCRQLGFDPPGAAHCGNSCFGRNRNLKGFTGIGCTGNETRLVDCTATRNNHKTCQNAGVLCETIPPPPPPPDCMACPPENCTRCRQATPQDCTMCPQEACPQTTCPTTSYPTPTLNTTPPNTSPPECVPRQDTPSTQEGQDQEQIGKTTTSCTAIGGGLGALAAGLALILVGVVMGWVWHCHRSRGKSNFQERDTNVMVTNPSYTSSHSKPHPSIQYSSHGPRDTPLNPSPSNPTAETSFATYDIVGSPAHPTSRGNHAPLQDRIYQVLEGPPERGVARKGGEKADYQDLDEERGGEGDYHVLGEIGGGAGEGGLTYEVPVPTKMSVQQAANKNTDMDYSLLHHQ